MTRYVVRLGSVRGKGAYVRGWDWAGLVTSGKRRAARFAAHEAARIASQVGGRVVRLRRKST